MRQLLVNARLLLVRFALLLICLVPPLHAAETHPRLWLTNADLPRLRAWAVPSNVLYRDALLPLAQRAKAEMDAGDVPRRDCGSTEYESYPAEMYAELFAFMSLVENDATARADYAARARTLLMGIINLALLGPASEANYTCPENQSVGYPPYRSPRFFTEDSNRARWHGEAFPLVVDWIYPILSSADKTAIRTVFLRWSQEIVERGYHHPTPVGLVNDPALTNDVSQLRWAGNNYFTAHMRNLGMMALALDIADDSNQQLRNYLGNATGAWLYLFDAHTRSESRGGLLPEGYEYSPQTASYAIQFLLALRSSGMDTCGRHCQLAANPFWDDFLSAFYHGLSPASTNDADLGQVYQPSWYGDGESYRSSDFISAFGALGVFDTLTANQTRLQSLRWAQLNMVPGGATALVNRAARPEDFRQSILYFMLYDPNASAAQDPRASLPLDFHAPGMNIFLSRTSWDSTASWFSYMLPWNLIDHQQANANHFEWYRKGEWLSKGRNGYPDIAEGIASSEFRNAVTLENDRPNRADGDWRLDLWQRGSQWNLVAQGDPQLGASSMNSAYTYVSGDATNVYNSSNESATDIVHASRSLVWLKPDAIFVFDRAQSKTANRFKRWWLQLASAPSISGKRALASTAGGQQLQVDNLLPSNAVLSAVTTTEPHIEQTAARGEPMKVRLRVSAPDNPNEVRFLHVLQAADAGVRIATPSLIQNAEQTWSGAQLGDSVVMFPNVLGSSVATLRYTSDARQHIITGLTANTGYGVSLNGNQFTLQLGGTVMSDSGGVLRYPSSTGIALRVNLAGTGSGSVSSSPAGIACGSTCQFDFASGSDVTLLANAAFGSTFAGWSGDCLGTANCILKMNAAKTVVATFNRSSGSTPPSAPRVVAAWPVENGVDLYFSPPSDQGSSAIQSYQASCSVSGQASRQASGLSSPIRVTDLSAGLAYACRLQASNAAGGGATSESISAMAQVSSGNQAMILTGNRADYQLRANANGTGFMLTDLVNGVSLQTANTQRLQFKDKFVALDINGNAGKVYRLYQAAFNRQPDQGGVGFHLATMEKHGLPLELVSKNFIDSAEFSATYGNLNNTQFVTQLYQNVLHRQPDPGGVAYWAGLLENPLVTRYGVLTGFSESNENKASVLRTIEHGFEYTPYTP